MTNDDPTRPPVFPAEVDPKTVDCPTCGVKVGEDCTRGKGPKGRACYNRWEAAAAEVERRREASKQILAQVTQDAYERDVKRTASRLRELADEFERAALRDYRDSGLDIKTYARSYAAASAVQDVQWGLANAHFDTIIKSAAEADAASRGARS
jgi:hypothetical protein